MTEIEALVVISILGIFFMYIKVAIPVFEQECDEFVEFVRRNK